MNFYDNYCKRLKILRHTGSIAQRRPTWLFHWGLHLMLLRTLSKQQQTLAATALNSMVKFMPIFTV